MIGNTAPKPQLSGAHCYLCALVRFIKCQPLLWGLHWPLQHLFLCHPTLKYTLSTPSHAWEVPTWPADYKLNTQTFFTHTFKARVFTWTPLDQAGIHASPSPPP